MNENKIPLYKEVTVSINMSKDFLVEVTEDMSNEDIINKAKKEIMLPIEIINTCKNIFNNLGIKATNIDFKDWFTNEAEFIIES